MIQDILAELDEHHVKLVAVSKTKPIEVILEFYNKGITIFGENKVQELVSKQKVLPKDIQWHMIGHLQTNKVKFIAPFVSIIHSIDRLKLLKEVNKQAKKNNRIIDCLLQISIAREETKYGLDEFEANELLQSVTYRSFQNIRITGVMGMATFTHDMEQVRQEFRQLKQIFDTLKHQFFKDQDAFCEISMGMSGDYKIAINEGSTIVRIGTLLFGKR